MDDETERIKARYNRTAALYDQVEYLVERLAYQRWRAKLWALVEGKRILEVGVGTGRNMPYYPQGAQVTAVDLSEKMLQRARWRARELGIVADLRVMDAQRLEFPDASFDAAVATFVFCSVPDPVAGLRELGRVVRPDGRTYLLEHMRVDKLVIGKLMDWLDPFVVRIIGAHIARRTVENVRKAGLEIERVEDVARGGLFRLIVARASSTL